MKRTIFNFSFPPKKAKIYWEIGFLLKYDSQYIARESKLTKKREQGKEQET